MKKYIYAILVSILIIAPLKAKDIHVGAWTIEEKIDEMTETHVYYIISDPATPTSPMHFPYDDVTARIVIKYDFPFRWIYLSFNAVPNLLNKKPKNGYDEIQINVKFDDDIKRIFLTQDWGARELYVLSPDDLFEKLIHSKTALFEFRWFGEGNVYFKFNLYGLSKAIDQMHRIRTLP